MVCYVCTDTYVCIHRPLLLRCVRGGLESSTTPARPFPMTFGARRSSFWASVNASVSSFFHCTNSGSLCRKKTPPLRDQLKSGGEIGATLCFYLTLQHELLPAFDTQQDAFLVFNLRLFHSNDLLHRQQVLL